MNKISGFGKSTSILMFDGTSKKIRDIKIGDVIMGPDALPKAIENIIQKKDKMYDIIPVKGIKHTVSEHHILLLKVSCSPCISWDKSKNAWRVTWLENFSLLIKRFYLKDFASKNKAYKAASIFTKNEIPKHNGYTKYGSIVKITVGEFIKLPNNVRRVYGVFSSGLNFEEIDASVDPYILGYWLGDGTSSNTGITTADPVVIEYFQKYAQENNLVFKKIENHKYDYALTTGTKKGGHKRNSFLNFLKENDLINNKHIPQCYMMNSRENRLRLLAGLVDSDGHNDCNCYDFVFKSEKLADDIIFLARSLGFKAFKKECQKTCTNSKHGRVTGTYYRFMIYGKGIEEIPSLLERKQTHKREQRKNSSVTGITIKYIGKQDNYILETNSNRLLLEDFTIVHK